MAMDYEGLVRVRKGKEGESKVPSSVFDLSDSI